MDLTADKSHGLVGFLAAGSEDIGALESALPGVDVDVDQAIALILGSEGVEHPGTPDPTSGSRKAMLCQLVSEGSAAASLRLTVPQSVTMKMERASAWSGFLRRYRASAESGVPFMPHLRLVAIGQVQPSEPEAAPLGQSKVVATEASALLGPKLTAYLAQLTSVSAIGELARGERTASAEVTQRVRVAIRAAQVVSQYNGTSAAQAWLQGKNRHLGGVSPARLLRETGATDAAPQVLSAARAFVAGA